MSTIYVAWKGVTDAIDEYSSERRELSDSIANLRSIKAYRCMSGYGFSSVYRTLDRIIQNLEREKRSIKSLEDALSEILNTYKQYENNIEGNVQVGEGESSETTNFFQWKWSDMWKVIAKGGIIGNVVAAAGGLITGGWSHSSAINALKNIVSGVGGIAGAVAKGSDANWRNALLGLDDALKSLDTSSAGSAFESSLVKQFGKDLSFKQAANGADKVKVGAKWAGHFLTLFSNAWENAEEFEGQEDALVRGTAETAIETVTDIGVGAVATAGVSAGITAALTALGCTVAAPAVAVGAGAVVVTWAANGVCKWLTGGKDIGEVAADLVCDSVQNGIDAVVSWGKSVFSFA